MRKEGDEENGGKEGETLDHAAVCDGRRGALYIADSHRPRRKHGPARDVLGDGCVGRAGAVDVVCDVIVEIGTTLECILLATCARARLPRNERCARAGRARVARLQRTGLVARADDRVASRFAWSRPTATLRYVAG